MSEFDDWICRRTIATDRLEPTRSNALARALGGAGDLVAGDPLHVCGAKADDGAELWTQQGEPKNMVATVHSGASA